ncbi:MAG: ABC transporter ATP-binding protein [Lachnospiraceae bacterium]|nr:ABC transporter ATP-binding protein [Lachnospiraceae bacterium]
MRPVIWLLAFSFGLSLFSSVLLNEYIQPKRDNIGRIYDGNYAAKFQQMDYSLIESPYVMKLNERIIRANNWGAGIYSVFWDFDAIVSGIFKLVSSVIIVFPLLKIIAESGNVWMYLGLAGLTAILCLLTIGIAKANASYQQWFLASLDELFPEEMRKKYVSTSWYWVMRCISGDYHFIKDIHLYDGYEMMEHYTTGNMREGEKQMPWVSVTEKLCGKLGFLRGTAESLITLAGFLISAAYALLGAFPVGDVIKFASAFTNMLSGVQNMAYQCNGLIVTARRAASTLEMMNIGDEMYRGKLPVEKRLDNQYEIEFRNVSFRYPGTETYALKNLSLKLHIGERMAIVGMNGSGKTTMIKLLCRLYDPQEGEILLNGVDIRKFRQEEYIRLFSVVFQDFKLLSMPLGENVAASLDVDEKLAEQVLRKAGLSERLAKLPEGLETWLYQDIADDGVEISGGEAQKIAIARALYKDAPFVLLDEPTASLDPLSEYEIYSGFDAMVGDKTAIYISHRLSSCRFCDDIAVFHEGRLVQRGTHEELLKDEQGKYYELWNAQAQYYT